MQPPLAILDLKAFVPAKDFRLSIEFYVRLGFTVNFEGEGVAEIQAGQYRFLLQKFYVAEHAGNFMMHLMVADVDAWWDRIERIKLKEVYPDMLLKAPALQSWGLRVAYISDPSGVLWHIAQRPIPHESTMH